MRNRDDACFAWAVTSALHPARRDGDRISSYPDYRQILNVEGINFPISRKGINKFESLNNISINVYILQKNKEVYKCVPSRLTPNKQSRHVNLLLIQDKYNDVDSENEDENDDDEENNVTKYHYVWIKDLSRLLSTGLSRHRGRKFFCDRCLQYFYSQTKLERHEEECATRNEYKVSFPEERYIKFKNQVNSERAPFIIYADFECLLKPLDIQSSNTSTKYQRHTAYSAGYYYKCDFDNSASHYNSYRGEDCDKWFANELSNIAQF